MSVQSKWVDRAESGHSHTKRRMHWVWECLLPLIFSSPALYCCVLGLAPRAQMQCTRKVWARQGSRWVQSEPDSCPARGHPCIVIIRRRGRVLGTRYRFSVTLLPVASLPPGQAGPDHATTANGHFSSPVSSCGLSPIYASSARCHPPPELTTAAAAVWADDTTSGSG